MVHLVGFTVEIYHDARPYKRQICDTWVTTYINTLRTGDADLRF